jgi:ribonuclease HII
MDPRTTSDLTVPRIRAELAKLDAIPDALRKALRRDRRATVRALVDEHVHPKRKRHNVPRDLLAHERKLWERGLTLVAGVDEAGRGPLAGPVCAAAVILPPGCDLAGVYDSKRLTAERREVLEPLIRKSATAVGVAFVDVELIDRINILQASLKAMRMAIADLGREPEHILVDGTFTPGSPFPETALVKGDELSLSVAAASIVAKVARDRHMIEMDRIYPGYGFAQHKGYGTRQHLAALRRLGPCPIHRRTFAGVEETVKTCSPGYRHMVRAISLTRSLDELRQVGEAIRDQVDEITRQERDRLRRQYRRQQKRLEQWGRR